MMHSRSSTATPSLRAVRPLSSAVELTLRLLFVRGAGEGIRDENDEVDEGVSDDPMAEAAEDSAPVGAGDDDDSEDDDGAPGHGHKGKTKTTVVFADGSKISAYSDDRMETTCRKHQDTTDNVRCRLTRSTIAGDNPAQGRPLG